MRILFLRLLVVLCALLPLASARAIISDQRELIIDFTKPEDAAAKASWSTPDVLAVTAQGLGWDGPAAQLRDGWVETRPLAIGLSWRPTAVASLRVSIGPAPAPIHLNSGQTHTPYAGQVYARYSPDREHWSNWQALSSAPAAPEAPGRIFVGLLGIPQREREAYGKLGEEYARLDVPWVDDEEARVKWILEKDPKFFERSLPFIGYVEFLFETSFYGGQRIAAFRASAGCGLSGLTRVAKDPAAAKGQDIPWRFKAP